MILRIAGVALALVTLLTGAAAFTLWRAHREIRSIAPPLPSIQQVLAVDPSADLPIALEWINTASQRGSREGVIEPSLDPAPGGPWTLTLAAFSLRWSDGRRFLIDAGMDREAAADFGRPTEWLLGYPPIEAFGPPGKQLGEDAQRVAAIAFTHLHVDHTQGLLDLCARNPKLVVFQTELQAKHLNYTTTPGEAHLEGAGCERRVLTETGAMKTVPGFPGLFVIEAGGHTPGSQIFVAHVRSQAGIQPWVFIGDIANHVAGIDLDLPKPKLYSLLIVPEAPDRLGALRRTLRDWRDTGGARLLLSHDQRQIESSGIPRLTPSPAPR